MATEMPQNDAPANVYLVNLWEFICFALSVQHDSDFIKMRQSVRDLMPLLAAGQLSKFDVFYTPEFRDGLNNSDTPDKVCGDFWRLCDALENGLPLPKGSLRGARKIADQDPLVDLWGIYHFGLGKGNDRYTAYACLGFHDSLALCFLDVSRHPDKRRYNEKLIGLLSQMLAYDLYKTTPWGVLPLPSNPELTVELKPNEIEELAYKTQGSLMMGFKVDGATVFPQPLRMAILRAHNRLRRNGIL